MSEPVLLIDKRDRIATFILNRPRALNALSRELRAALVAAFNGLRDDPEIGVVILTGSGRAFTAGLDLKELGDEGFGAGATEAAVADADVIRAMARCAQPIIGAINGFAVTGGFEIALACDLLICSSAARFADTHARVGILPGWGLSQKLPRMIGSVRAKAVSLTGNYVTAVEAERWGLLAKVVEPDALLPTAKALARDMLSCDPETLRGYKRVIDDGLAGSYADGRAMESERSIAHAKSVTPAQIAERRRGVQARGREQQQKLPG